MPTPLVWSRPRGLPGSRTLLALLAALLVLGSASCCKVKPVPDPVTPTSGAPLVGFVDLHTHPMANLGFAGKLLYGGPDYAAAGGSLLPSDPDCNENVPAKSLEQALGHDKSTHAGFDLVHNRCGDWIRAKVVEQLQVMNDANNPPADATGSPAFEHWPKWNDVTHQVMWVESLRRAHEAGLRVMVALAVNNTTMADLVGGPSDGPDDDQGSADLQIAHLKALVARHPDFMEVAYTSADLQRIVAAGRLAVVLGIEVDNLGNVNRYDELTHEQIRQEIERLWADGVRYVFPIHLIDNPFGSTAAYLDIFNLSNLREAGHFWNLECASPADHIGYRPTLKNPLLEPSAPGAFELAMLMIFKLHLFSLDDPSPPACPDGVGVVNRGIPHPGLTPDGEFAIREMMRQGMLLDVDHMSQAAANEALALAVAEGYPINSGHNGVRRNGGSERSLTAAQYAKIAAVHGLAGVGSARVDHVTWVAEAQAVLQAMGGAGALAFGTDANGVSALMPPPPPGAPPVVYSASYPMSTLGAASWDYNAVGVAHYGMISDYLRGVVQVDGGQPLVDHLRRGAQAFHDSWARAEAYRRAHLADSGKPAHRALALKSAPACPEGTTLRPACGRCLKPRERCPTCEPGAADCLRPPRGPQGQPRSPWGAWSQKSADLKATRSLEAPLFSNFERARTGAGSTPPGRYVLTLGGKSVARTSFNLELEESERGWTLKGGKGRTTASGGLAKTLWALEWTSGDGKLVLLARPEAGKPLQGAFALHRPGAPSVTGEFELEPSTTSQRGAQDFDQLPGFLDLLR